MKHGLNTDFMREAIRLARVKMLAGAGGPFGAIVVRDGKIISRGWNCVTSGNDPTAHAEVTAIRKACRKLKTFSLEGCELYASCEPCPMCLAAIYWARLKRVNFAATRKDAARAGFDDDLIYHEISKSSARRKLPMKQFLRAEAVEVFAAWKALPDKTCY